MKVIMLGGKGESTLFIYNALKNDFLIEKVIVESKVSNKNLIKSRIKKLGFFKVLNQILFQLTISKFLKILSHTRKQKLKIKYDLSNKEIDNSLLLNVSSINHDECLLAIKKINPDVIVVNGTRIISKKVLECTPAIFINTHVGITPEYRGVHGGYWSLVNNDGKNCGVTIHKVDKGIDTGDIICQDTIKITEKDNFATYPYHQYGVAIPLLKSTLDKIENNELISYRKDSSNSNLFYHPTFSGYLYNRIFKKVK